MKILGVTRPTVCTAGTGTAPVVRSRPVRDEVRVRCAPLDSNLNERVQNPSGESENFYIS